MKYKSRVVMTEGTVPVPQDRPSACDDAVLFVQEISQFDGSWCGWVETAVSIHGRQATGTHG